MSPMNLYRLCGFALLLSVPIGLLGHVIVHPPGHSLENMASARWIPAHSLILAQAFLLLLGLPGLYVRQASNAGVLGLAGFVLTFLGVTSGVSTMVYEVFVIPVLVADPTYQSLLALNGPVTGGPFGVYQTVLGGYIFAWGAILFGAATIRAGVLPRAVGVSLAIVGVAFLVLRVPVPVPILLLGLVLFCLGFAWPGWTLFRSDAAATSVRVSAPARGTA
jgi:hypothetical protein